MDFLNDTTKATFRVRYIGWTRSGFLWWRKPKPTWVVEQYTECWGTMPEDDSRWVYREVSRWTCPVDANRELNRFQGVN